MNNTPSPTLITGEAILSFPTFLKPRSMKNAKGEPDGKEKYGCTLVFPLGEPGKYLPGPINVTALKAAATECAKNAFGAKLATLIKEGTFRSPFLKKDSEIEKRGYPVGPDGTVYIRVTSMKKPGCASNRKGPDNKVLMLSDREVEEMLYAGARVRASIRPFPYEYLGNCGVSFALNNIQFLGDGERMDGRQNPQDEFEPTVDEADLPDLPEQDAPSKTTDSAKSASLEDVL